MLLPQMQSVARNAQDSSQECARPAGVKTEEVSNTLWDVCKGLLADQMLRVCADI